MAEVKKPTRGATVEPRTLEEPTEPEIKSPPQLMKRLWAHTFVKVWPPKLLKSPYALTAYCLIKPEVVTDGSSIGERTTETVLCFVSDGTKETQETAYIRYAVSCTPHSGGIEQIDFVSSEFESEKGKEDKRLGEEAEMELFKVLEKDDDSFAGRCDSAPYREEEEGLFKVTQLVRDALRNGVFDSKDKWEFQKEGLKKGLCKLLKIDPHG
jgi:hypothetical protein